MKRLYIKWGSYSDITNIVKLKKLECLYIGSGASVKAIHPLTSLTNLISLSLSNFQKITDYSCLSSLKKLESLTIVGDGFSPRFIKVDSLDFLKEMTQLRFFECLTVRLQDKDYIPVLQLQNLEHLTLSSRKEVKKLYDELVSLPRLKYGLLKEHPDMYK